MSKVETISAISEVAEYALSSFKLIKRQRVNDFLTTVSYKKDCFSEKENEKFVKFLDSNAGKEILTDFIESAHKTSSLQSRTALALIYSYAAVGKYKNDFVSSAALALESLNDVSVDILMEILDQHMNDDSVTNKSFNEEDDLYIQFSVPIVKEGGEIKKKKDLNPAERAKAELWIGTIEDLKGRGILLPDSASGRFGGEEARTPTFGVGQKTQEFKKLFKEARALLHV